MRNTITSLLYISWLVFLLLLVIIIVWGLLFPSAVHVFSTFDFGAVFHDCLSADHQGNPPFSPLFRAPRMLLPSVIHVSSSFKFGAMFHDCLSADPQGNPPLSPFFGAP